MKLLAGARVVVVGLCGWGAACAWGDRLIDIPTAHKLKYRTVRFEYADEVSGGGSQFSYLDAGIGTSFEATIKTERLAPSPAEVGVDVTYNYLSPIVGLTPGFAAGVQDIDNRTVDGRRAFVCTTWAEPAQTINGEMADELTLGIYYRNRPYGFVGASIPFSKEVRLLAEHNGDRLSAGIEVKPFATLAFRFLARGSKTLASMSVTQRF